MDVELLARIQFAVTIAFHYIYPPLSIGLGLCLLIMESMWLATKKERYREMTQFWVKIFGLIFAIGVVTGIVMEFEFGTNWAAYSRYVGDVFGSALAAEGIFAFFLESGFLAILLFGWNKVGPKMHWFSTLMVCLGSHFSAVWIVIANSWQQTPAGYHIVETPYGPRAEITDFWAMVFNPSSIDRLTHTIIGCWIAGAFLLISVGAYYLLKKREEAFAKTTLKIGLSVGLVACLLQGLSGSISAEGVAENQPTKLAAMEGHYAENAPADMYLFGWVDESQQEVHGIKVKGMLSWLIYRDTEAPVVGLNAFPEEDHPPVNLTFQFYHIMIAIGGVLIAISLVGCIGWWRGWVFTYRPFLWVLVFAVLLPQLGNQFGWFTAEVGRQPWVVWGLMRTSEGLSEVVTAQHVVTSLILFTIIYALLFALFIFLLNHKIKVGPGKHDEMDEGYGHKARSLVDQIPNTEN
ncbi:MAG: cytochrome ubiquinol oxidase subunit I [Opitutales bacterium]|nr:cytochrome ubiquinol oxidase subunit I [Opitutales bacterium]